MMPVEHLDMGAGGDLGHDAAIGRVLGDLAHRPVGENLARAVRCRMLDDGGGGFVAGGLDSQNAHRLSKDRRAAFARDGDTL
jgi:hypothetical protein